MCVCVCLCVCTALAQVCLLPILVAASRSLTPQQGGASEHDRRDHMQTVVTTAELFFLHHVRTSAASAVGNNLAMLWRLIFIFLKAPGGSHEPILKHF